MKRILFVLTLFALAPALVAQTDRSMVLAENGTLYAVESRINDESGSGIGSTRYLTLTVQRGDTVIKSNVPASLSGGNNWQPEIAIDDESDTLFVFWIHSQNSILAANELLFCTYQNGRWNDAASVEDIPYHFRYNLRIGVTRFVQATDSGNVIQVPGLTVHVTWWDDSATGELARYAMLTIEKGKVTAIVHRDLVDFVNAAFLRNFASAGNSDILRHPVVIESPARDTVDVVFGNTTLNMMHRVTLKPVLNSRVRIPIGVREVSYPVPSYQMASDSARVSAISTPPDRLVLYYVGGGAVRYLSYASGVWSDQSISVTPEVSADAAVSALRRMVSGD